MHNLMVIIFTISVRFIVSAIFSCIALPLLHTSAFAQVSANFAPQSYKDINFSDGKMLRVGVSHNPPFASHGNGMRPKGFFVDLIKYVAEQERWNIEYVERPWPELLKLLEVGKIDLLGGIAYTPGRAKRFNFSKETAANNWAVVYRSDGVQVNGIANLGGKRIALIPKGVHTRALEQLARSFEFEYVAIPAKDYDHTLKLIDIGKADVGVVARTFHNLHGSSYRALSTNVRFNPVQIRFAAPLGAGQEVLAAIDRHLSDGFNDRSSRYNSLLAKWFSGPVKEVVPFWLSWFIWGAIGIAVLTGAFVALLHKQVQDKTAEAKHSENEYKSLFENAAEGIFRSNMNGEFISANPAMARVLGYRSPVELMKKVKDIGRQLFVNADEREACISALQSDGHFTGKEVQWKKSDGTLVWLSESVRTSLTNEGEQVFDGTIQDITERKNMELEIVESGERFHELSEASVEGLLIHDNGKIIDANTRFQEMFGYNRDELRSKNSIELLVQKNQREVEKRILATEGGTHRLSGVRKDGTEFPLEVHVRNSVYQGRPVRIAACQDISEREHVEAQLRRSQRMEAVGQLTGGVAHDFNNLLAVVNGHAELLVRNVDDDERRVHSANAIKRAVLRGSSLTGRLLAFSRIQPLSPIVTNVSKLIYGLEDMLQRTLGETITVNVVTGPDLWPALIDSHQLEDALLNLSINARDAMPKGGNLTFEIMNVTLDDDYAQKHEEVSLGDYVKVEVTDTGGGIPSEKLEKVFEPFFTTKEIGKGSGLGLSMVYGFIKQSNGHITIYSEVDHGTTIKLYLPRSRQGVVEERQRVGNNVPTRGSEHILVVEDDEMVREIPVRILREHGYKTVEAGNGDEAIKLLEGGSKFDLLFTDVVLPGVMSGPDIAEVAIRMLPNIKVIYATGYAENGVVHNGNLDADVILFRKPYNLDELLQTVRTTLDDHNTF